MVRPFKGVINLDLKESTEDWEAFLADRAPEGAPNVLVVLYDDTGQAAWSPYGGRIQMPTMQRLADNGLTYSQWHTTALCSPTRSCLLTGRNHHQNGFASISETATGFPGYSSHIPPECAPMATVLRDAGWSTFWIGKNHNVPVDEWTMGSSKKNWPLGMGYDRFYGFLGGETNNWYPDLAEDNHYVDQPYLPEDGYHLSKDLADKALEFIRDSKQSEPDKPWYLWFCPGANHAPHHCPQDYIDKYKGVFDDGYEAYREWALPRMIERGILPEGTELSPINPMAPGTFSEGDSVRPWDECSDEEKALFCRMAEVYAGFSEYTDAQVGRIIDYLEQSGQLDNTIVFYCADNGASGEGSPNGSVNEGKLMNTFPDRMEDNLPLLDKLGSPDTYNHYPTGWAVAFSTPYRMFKRYSYQGGVCDPLVISWPAGIKARGEVRNQYHHAVDIVPTILECCGVEFPTTYNGVTQAPLPGVSMKYTFDAEPDAPTTKVTQYYELLGSRGLWHDGWKVVTEHGPLAGIGFGDDRWQLFHTDEDRSEAHDLADQHPDKVEELKALWYAEAGKYNVLPLNSYAMTGQSIIDFFARQYHVAVPKTGQYTYYPGTSEVPEHSAANTHVSSFKVLAEVDVTADAEGVIFAQGSRHGGHAMFLKDHKLHYVYNFLGVGEEQTFVADGFAPGKHVFGIEFDRQSVDEDHQPTGTTKLFVDDQVVDEGPMRVMAIQFSLCGEGLTVGYDGGDAVSKLYGHRFEFTGGTIAKVVFDVADGTYLDVETQLAALMARDWGAVASEAILESWNDTPTRRAIVDFVARVTTDGPGFVPIAERIATFDNDGTLWCEKPMPIELGFILQRLAAMAETDASLRDTQPWKAAHEKDYAWLGAVITKHYQGDDADVKVLMGGILRAFGGMTVDDYEASAGQYVRGSQHPTLGRALKDCAFLPMIELLRYLEANEFTVLIASGGDRDFMRSISDEIYAIPPERVIGSTNGLAYEENEHGGRIVYQAEPDYFDDGPAKPVRIWSRTGRRPLLAGGNSNGDIPMLRFADSSARDGLRLLVLHDDAEREFDYTAGAEDALERAHAHGWTVVSVKHDWSTVFGD